MCLLRIIMFPLKQQLDVPICKLTHIVKIHLLVFRFLSLPHLQRAHRLEPSHWVVASCDTAESGLELRTPSGRSRYLGAVIELNGGGHVFATTAPF